MEDTYIYVFIGVDIVVVISYRTTNYGNNMIAKWNDVSIHDFALNISTINKAINVYVTYQLAE